DLDGERLATFQTVREPPQLRYELGTRVGLFNVALGLAGHLRLLNHESRETMSGRASELGFSGSRTMPFAMSQARPSSIRRSVLDMIAPPRRSMNSSLPRPGGMGSRNSITAGPGYLR